MTNITKVQIVMIGLEVLMLVGCSKYVAEPYTNNNAKNYNYTYDPYKGRERAIEDCNYYRLGQKNKDEFCEDVIKSNYKYRNFDNNKEVIIIDKRN